MVIIGLLGFVIRYREEWRRADRDVRVDIAHMIVSGGFNVYATEVEAAISTHSSVLVAAVVGIPHEEWGEAIHAEVILKEGHELDASALILHVKDRLARFKAPKSVAFVSELPLSAAGKVLRRMVREKYWAGHDRRVS